MNTALELTMSYDDGYWIIDDMGSQLRGENLDHLEANIANHIKFDPRFNDNHTIDVTLRFDMDHFPGWLLQYQSHYFNYTFTIEKPQQVK